MPGASPAVGVPTTVPAAVPEAGASFSHVWLDVAVQLNEPPIAFDTASEKVGSGCAVFPCWLRADGVTTRVGVGAATVSVTGTCIGVPEDGVSVMVPE